MFQPRPMQAEVLKYTSGRMGVSAVPGSGKTHTLSYLAAQLIMNSELQNDQEILIVTLVNSAVNNFSSRIAGFIQEKGLLPDIGYRVRTLHGLAHDIVRERPELAGLNEHFSIVDDGETNRMIEEYSSAYLHIHPEIENTYVLSDYLPLENRLRQQWNTLVNSICLSFISQAKDWRLDPETLQDRQEKAQIVDPLFTMAVDVYYQYQRGLRARNAVDFSDLIRLAYLVINSDPDYLALLRHRWPFILEDEAQDSSLIQENILRELVGPEGNWVRVGDPNQAIYETFTTASPKYLRNFLAEPGVIRRDLANSGRSNLSIIRMANELIDWTNSSHPNTDLQGSLSTPFILPTDPGDPQPNPPDQPNAIYIHQSGYSPDTEITSVTRSIAKWLPQNEGKTIAVLSPIGSHGEKVVESLSAAGIKVVEMLKSSESTRVTCRILEKIINSLADPSSSVKLSQAFFEIYRQKEKEYSDQGTITRIQNLIKSCRQVEDYLYPHPGNDWLDQSQYSITREETDLLSEFKARMVRWHQATLLPIDQLILTLAYDLFSSPNELALSHKIALSLEFSARIHSEYQLSDFSLDLAEIASNRRKFLGFSDDENGFDPESHKGEVFVSTYHKAKGLEWDRVYLLSVNNYDFPSAEEFDQYQGEKWFIRGQLNLEAEVLAKLRGLYENNPAIYEMEEGEATQKARIDYAAERLRLLYVGITRAKENLIITWNTGKQNNSKMALALSALSAYLEEKNETS